MEKVKITYEQFLETVTSPQFRKNAREIYDFLQKTEEESEMLRLAGAICAKSFIAIYDAYQDLLMMKETMTQKRIEGKTYKIEAPDLIKTVLDMVETSYLNSLSGVDFSFDRLPLEASWIQDIMNDPKAPWLEDENYNELALDKFIQYYFNKNEIKLFIPRLGARLIIKWKQQVIMQIPYHEDMERRGRPFSLESVEDQIKKLETAMDNGDVLMKSSQEDMINRFIVSLLDARVKRDNKLYRDVYEILRLYNRIPEEILKTHDATVDTSHYIRENYIRKKFETLIDNNPEYQKWYKKK